MWIDLAGGCLVAGLLGTFVWLAFFKDDPAKRERSSLSRAIASSRRELTSLTTAHDQQQALLTAQQAELKSSGQLPEHPPIEQDLQTLVTLATDHHLRVLRITPLPSQQYPGLLELRYSFETVGTMPDLARFFKAIEEADCWADISYLKVTSSRPARAGESQSNSLLAVLTVSLFSSSPSEGEGRSG